MLAPAKVNLMLHVTAKRADHYHLLQSLVMFADICDEITYREAEDFSLALTGPFAGGLSADDNLVTKAAHALAQACNMKARGVLTLRKNLPIGAGLGGGSADAAAALRLLCEHWHCNTDLPAIAKALGSDVVACLYNVPCWMEDVGSTVTPVSIAFEVPVLLVNPGLHVSTPDVYRALTPPYDTEITLPKSFSSQQELLAFLSRTHNALQPPALALAPVIGEVLAAIKGCELARMSGSGATCFGIFSTMKACETAGELLQAAHPAWWIRATTLRGAHG